ncbi:MAG: autotransporter outer membrane beta-barrel domain-containing protein [Planctomycetia bacterium]|nr:autotransporter outer membrane beta-barrel domain-containing protein [Planctomycetia bacterium]
MDDQNLGSFDAGDGSWYESNYMFVTKDENGDPTAIDYDVTYDNIRASIRGSHIFMGKLKSDGVVSIQQSGDVSASAPREANAYNIIFTGNQSEFNGDTQLYKGAMVLATTNVTEGVYGNTSDGTFNIYREVLKAEYSDPSTKKNIARYEVLSLGQLAFMAAHTFSATNDIAPIVNAKEVNFGAYLSDDTADADARFGGGARLWLSVDRVSGVDGAGKEIFDFSTNRTLGTINAQSITIAKDTSVWYDHVSTLDEGTQLTFNLNASDISIDTGYGTDDEVQVTENNKDSIDLLNGIFSTGLVNAKAATTTDGFQIVSTVWDVATFAQNQNMSAEEQEYAQTIDDLRQDAAANNMFSPFNDALFNASAKDVKQTIHNLARGSGIENVTMMAGHMGNPTSTFFGGGLTSMSGTTTRGQEENAPEAKPSDPGTAAKETTSSSSQSYPSNKWTAWASFSHTSINGSAYDEGGIHYDGYDVRRTGFLTGLRRQLSDTFSGGILFAYSSPELSQSGIYEGFSENRDGGYASNIDMDDFQFALHFEKMLARNWELSVFVGGGAQSLDWERRVFLPNVNELYTSDTSGNTFTATFYLVKRLQFTEFLSLSPTFGLDIEHSWIDGFSEEGNDVQNNYMILSTQRFSYDDIHYHRETLRIGLSGHCTDLSQMFGMTARIFYGRQLGDEDAATVHLWNENFKRGWDITGNAMGRDSLNLGLGMYRYLNYAKTLSLSADYNAVMYSHAMTQNITAGLQWRF